MDGVISMERWREYQLQLEYEGKSEAEKEDFELLFICVPAYITIQLNELEDATKKAITETPPGKRLEKGVRKKLMKALIKRSVMKRLRFKYKYIKRRISRWLRKKWDWYCERWVEKHIIAKAEEDEDLEWPSPPILPHQRGKGAEVAYQERYARDMGPDLFLPLAYHRFQEAIEQPSLVERLAQRRQEKAEQGEITHYKVKEPVIYDRLGRKVESREAISEEAKRIEMINEETNIPDEFHMKVNDIVNAFELLMHRSDLSWQNRMKASLQLISKLSKATLHHHTIDPTTKAWCRDELGRLEGVVIGYISETSPTADDSTEIDIERRIRRLWNTVWDVAQTYLGPILDDLATRELAEKMAGIARKQGFPFRADYISDSWVVKGLKKQIPHIKEILKQIKPSELGILKELVAHSEEDEEEKEADET